MNHSNPKANLLLVEDNLNILHGNAEFLALKGYAVRTAQTLQGAACEVAAHPPDLIVLDILMPDGNGLGFCRSLREGIGFAAPVLFLTALGEKAQVVEGLRAGGDDYLTKPYDAAEMLARVEALLRRVELDTRRAARETVRAYGPLRVDTMMDRVTLGGAEIALKPMEIRLLKLLAERPEEYITAEELYARAWGGDPAGDLRTVFVHIAGLRKKLDTGMHPGIWIEHRKGLGYRLTAQVNTENV